MRAALVLAGVAAAVAGVVHPPSYPTQVYFQLTLNDLRKIDAVESTYILDFYVAIAWRDDRLFTNTGGDFDPSTMFKPNPEFLNAQDNFGIELEYKIIDSTLIPAWTRYVPDPNASPNMTWVVATGRKQGPFVAELQLQEFPFDKQRAVVYMESSTYRLGELIWVPCDIINGLSVVQSDVSGWDSIGAETTLLNQTYPALQESYSRLYMAKILRRQSGYYLSRVVSNVIMLVIMAAFASFMRATEADRLGYVQSSFLGVVSWLFVLSAEVPRVGYLTRLDAFTQVSFAAIFAIYIYHAISWGYFKFIDRCSGRPTDDDKEGGDSPTHHHHYYHAPHHPSIEDASGAAGKDKLTVATAGASTPQEKSVKQIAIASAATEGEGASSASATGAVQVGVELTAIGAAAATSTAVATKAASHEEGDDKDAKKPRKSQCKTWPFSWYGTWGEFNPHRKLDVLVVATIMAVYAFAVAGIIGQGMRNSEKNEF